MLAGGRPPTDLSEALARCVLTAVHMLHTSQAANAQQPHGMDRSVKFQVSNAFGI